MASTARRSKRKSKNRFKYAPLKDPATQIRLLKIEAAHFNKDIHCTMRIVDFGRKRPTYEAVSYVWGPETRLHDIFIDKKRFAVRENCMYALRQVRLQQDRHTPIWIDAICINQYDISEKSNQVSFMGDIYASASRVFACIGPTARGFAFIKDMSHDFHRLQHHIFDLHGSGPVQSCKICLEHHPGGMSPFRKHVAHTWLSLIDADTVTSLSKALENVQKRPYWSRLWVIQELALAVDVDVLCGLDAVKLKFFKDLTAIFGEFEGLDQHESHPWSSLASVRDLIDDDLSMRHSDLRTMLRFERDLTITDVFWSGETSKMKCQNSLDRIYALLSLIKWPADSRPLIPDYSITAFEAVVQLIHRTGLDDTGVQTIFWALDAVEISVQNSQCEIQSFLDSNNAARGGNTESSKQLVTNCGCTYPLVPQVVAYVSQIMGVGYGCTHINPDGDLVVVVGDQEQHSCCKVQILDANLLCKGASYKTKQAGDILIFGECMVGDLLIGLEPQLVNDSGAFWSCVVVREFENGYYGVVGASRPQQLFPWCHAGPSCTSWCFNRKQATTKSAEGHVLWLNADDAIAYSLICEFSEPSDQSEKDLVTSGSGNGCKYSFPGRLFSSFATPPAASPAEDNAAHVKILGVPSMDGRTIPCATCGGLFEPGVSYSLRSSRKR